MANFKHDEKKLLIKLDVEELSPAQVRLIKSIQTMLMHVLTTEDEAEFFDCSAEFMRTCASLIKLANFATDLKSNGIPYADQALEYSMDSVYEKMSGHKVINYDN